MDGLETSLPLPVSDWTNANEGIPEPIVIHAYRYWFTSLNALEHFKRIMLAQFPGCEFKTIY
jgi:hypothetical protein